MIYELKQTIARQVQQTLADAFGITADQYRVNVQYPARPEFGDFSFAFPFELAKVLRRGPAQIAAQFVEKFAPPDGVRKVEIAGGGYVNLYLDSWTILRRVLSRLKQDPLWMPFEPDGDKYIVEHTNINPNKAAHIGHLRNAVLGDTWCACCRLNGKRVEVQNYIDNTGVQVADVVVGFHHLEKHDPGAGAGRSPGKFDYYCWDLYARVASLLRSSPRRTGSCGSRCCTPSRSGEGETAPHGRARRRRASSAATWTPWRLDIGYDVLPAGKRDPPPEVLGHGLRAAEGTRGDDFESEGPEQGLLGHEVREGRPGGRARSSSAPTVPSPTPARTSPTSSGSWASSARISTIAPSATIPTGTSCGARPTSPGDRRPTAPSFGGGQWVYNVIDSRQSLHPERGLRGRARGWALTEAAAQHPLRLRDGGAVAPLRAGAGLRAVRRGEAAHPRGGSGRRGLGVKADDLLDRLDRTRGPKCSAQSRPGPAADGPDRPADRRGRAALLSCSSSPATR